MSSSVDTYHHYKRSPLDIILPKSQEGLQPVYKRKNPKEIVDFFDEIQPDINGYCERLKTEDHSGHLFNVTPMKWAAAGNIDRTQLCANLADPLESVLGGHIMTMPSGRNFKDEENVWREMHHIPDNTRDCLVGTLLSRARKIAKVDNVREVYTAANKGSYQDLHLFHAHQVGIEQKEPEVITDREILTSYLASEETRDMLEEIVEYRIQQNGLPYNCTDTEVDEFGVATFEFHRNLTGDELSYLWTGLETDVNRAWEEYGWNPQEAGAAVTHVIDQERKEKVKLKTTKQKNRLGEGFVQSTRNLLLGERISLSPEESRLYLDKSKYYAQLIDS